MTPMEILHSGIIIHVGLPIAIPVTAMRRVRLSMVERVDFRGFMGEGVLFVVDISDHHLPLVVRFGM